MTESVVIRRSVANHLGAIQRIYNEGIEDRLATLDTDPKSSAEMSDWWSKHDGRFVVLVALEGDAVVGWASLNQFSQRCAHSAIADLSVYVARTHRGQGVGSALLFALASEARAGGFHKIVLHALNANEHGKRLYRRSGFREVGIYREHAILDGNYVDVVVMEKLLRTASLRP